MSETYFLKDLSVDIRSDTVEMACITVAWSLPPSSVPMVVSEQFSIFLLMYMAICLACTMLRLRDLDRSISLEILKYSQTVVCTLSIEISLLSSPTICPAMVSASSRVIF